MEELVLHLVLSGHKLHVVYKEQIRFPVLGPELAAPSGPDQADEFIDEIVALDIDDFRVRVVSPDDIGDGVEQMGLAQAGIPIDQQRIVVLGRVFRHCHGRGVGQLVGGAHHEGLKGEFRGGKAVRLFGRRVPLESSSSFTSKSMEKMSRREFLILPRNRDSM